MVNSERSRGTDMVADEKEAQKINERLSQLEEAHQEWLSKDEKTRGRFNLAWMRNNGYSAGLYVWILKHGGIEDLVSKASEELRKDFDYEKKVNPIH